MADVQLEHGHMRMARSFIDALLRQKLTGRQWTVLMAVARLTWGHDEPPYARKTARIGSRRIQQMTGIDERAVRRELELLRRRRILGRRRDGQWYVWGIRKDFDYWKGEVRTSVSADEQSADTGAQGAGALASADTDVRRSADTGDPHLKRKENRRRRTNSRPQKKSQKSELTPLGETLRNLELVP